VGGGGVFGFWSTRTDEVDRKLGVVGGGGGRIFSGRHREPFTGGGWGSRGGGRERKRVGGGESLVDGGSGVGGKNRGDMRGGP